ncbi:MAG TPA: cell wall metabolism sensor histidine kinase WalK [Bacillota bacterium]|nr:cell wall metabolism sensor histidine kinase WalK [Bacillota bacterium]
MKKVGFFRSIQLKFIIIYILLLLVAMQVIGSYFAREIEEELLDNFYSSVDDRVDLLNYNLEQTFSRERDTDDGDPTLEQEVQSVVSEIDTTTISSLQVLNNQSRVIGTNDYFNRDIIGKRTTNNIIQETLRHGTSSAHNSVQQQTEERFYVKSEPIHDEEGDVVGAIYVESSLEGVYSQLGNINRIFLRGSILAITISAILGIFVARAITRPIIEMREQAQTMARGDFSKKVNVYGTDEISHLAEAFNDLNDRLKHSIALTENERQKLQSVLANMSEGVIATEKDGRISVINEAAEKLLGRSRTKLEDQYLLEFLDVEDKISHVSELQESGPMIIDVSDGKGETLVKVTFSTILNERNEISGFIAVLTDVTEQERIDQERREFVSNVSHELRTPLTTMRSYLEALTDGAWKEEEIAPRFLNVTQDETERMIRLVNDLLQLSRMDQKEYTLQRERTEFVSYFREVVERFEINVTSEIQFEYKMPQRKMFVWIDRDKMTQVLDNIISNAIKYSPEGGKIRLSIERKNRQLYVQIQDEGIGIPEEMHEKIFERFYRADKARTRKLGGSGLGLAISKEIVEAHYGKIWVKNTKENKGTTIAFTLPLMSQTRRLRS